MVRNLARYDELQIYSYRAVARSPRRVVALTVPWRAIAGGRHPSTVCASARITSTRRDHDGHRPSITAAKCPRVVNGSLTGSEHHRSRSEGTLRRHRSNHDASSPRRDRAPASSARPSPIPHRVRDRTTTPSSRRLREQIPKVWGYGSWRRQAAGSAPASGQRRHHRQPSRASSPSTTSRSHQHHGADRRPIADGITSSRRGRWLGKQVTSPA
jgi:hypothetical protein